MSRGEDESDKRGGEEHLDDGDVAIIAAEYLRERVGMIDAESLGGTLRGPSISSWCVTRTRADSPTARQL